MSLFSLRQKPAAPPAVNTPTSPKSAAAAAHPLDAVTGGAFSAPTSGERAARIREWASLPIGVVTVAKPLATMKLVVCASPDYLSTAPAIDTPAALEDHACILFAAQVQVGPPTFALFTTGFLEPGYRRFIQRRLRETYGFEGTPIEVGMRVREKRKRT